VPTDDPQRMLAAYRARTVPDAATRAAMLARLQPTGRPRVDVRRMALTIGIAVAIAAAILVVVGGIARVLVPRATTPAHDEAVLGAADAGTHGRAAAVTEIDGGARARAPVEAPALPTVPASPIAPAAARVEPAPGVAAQPRVRPQPRASASTPAADAPSSIVAEAQLLARAQTALLERDPAGALAVLEEYARRFPAGAMALERAALHAIASCQATPGEASAQRGRAVLADPDAASYAARIHSACKL